jgi:Crinkler effector protein N-terminal domain
MNPPTRHLWCIIAGDSTPFQITVADISIDQLKVDIRERKKQRTLSDIDASDLDLWKVSSFYRPAQTF